MDTKAKKALAVAVAGALSLSLAACGSSNNNDNSGSSAGSSPSSSASSSSPASSPAASSPSADSGKKVKLTFQNIYPDPNTPTYKTLHQLIDQYQKDHPNITIELDTLNTDQQKLKLKTQANSKEIPDITMVNPAAQMKPFVDANLFVPLNDMLDQNGLKDTYQSGLLDYYSFNGNTYALPDGNNIEVVYYNKDLFQQAGISAPPTTFDDLLADVKALKAKGIIPMAIGEKDTWTGSFIFMNILLRTNGPGFLQDVVDGKKTFEDPAFTEAVQRFQDLIQAGAFEDGATSIDADTGRSLFTTGKAAMYMLGTWETGSIDASPVGPKVAAFQFPTVDGKGDVNQFMLAPGTGYAIAANSEHIQEAKDFLNYYCLNFPKVQFENKNAVGLPQKVDGDLKAAGYSDLAISVMDLFSKVNGGDISFDNTMNPAVSQAHLTSLQNLFVQKVDPAQVAKEHQSAYDANKDK